MLISEFVRLYPRLFHMAADGSWPSIERHGLLSTTGLLDRWEVAPQVRSELLHSARVSSAVVEHPDFGRAIVRDQKPIHIPSLASSLDGMTVAEWLDALNDRVFFFVQRERMQGLLSARSYRGRPHTVITIDTARLVADYESRIELCGINSGFAQRHSKAARGRNTFQPIAAYRHPDREVPRTRPRWDIAELSIRTGVPNVCDYVVRVDRMQDAVVLDRIV